MPRRAELITVGIAVVVHIGLGLTVVRAGRNPPQPPKPKQVLLQFEKRPETPPAPPSTPKVAAAPVPRAHDRQAQPDVNDHRDAHGDELRSTRHERPPRTRCRR